MKLTAPRALHCLAVTAGLALCAPMASAQDPAPKNHQPAQPAWKSVKVINAPSPAGKDSASTAMANASRAHIDPATGKIKEPDAGDSAEISSLLQEPLLTSNSTSQPVQHPDGSVSVVLGPEHLNVSVIRIGPDGKLSEECLPGVAKALQSVKEAASKKASPAKEVVRER